jgi:hypothetical protein
MVTRLAIFTDIYHSFLSPSITAISNRQLFKDLNILPVICRYASEIVWYMKINPEKIEQNKEIHKQNTVGSPCLAVHNQRF